MADKIKVFWIEPTGRVQRYLRCYGNSDASAAAEPCRSYHNACVPLDVVALEYSDPVGKIQRGYSAADFADRDWPLSCSKCGVPFSSLTDAQRQIFTDQIYRAADGREFPLREAPLGAMWHAEWLADAWGYVGADGIALCVILPNGRHWMVDSQASNCTRDQRVPVPDQPGYTRFVRSHYCWCRHGDPRTGEIHVDKNGETCAAGAGSIQSGDWHGFLHNGYLVSC